MIIDDDGRIIERIRGQEKSGIPWNDLSLKTDPMNVGQA
jgi:hypothetical protein